MLLCMLWYSINVYCVALLECNTQACLVEPRRVQKRCEWCRERYFQQAMTKDPPMMIDNVQRRFGESTKAAAVAWGIVEKGNARQGK